MLAAGARVHAEAGGECKRGSLRAAAGALFWRLLRLCACAVPLRLLLLSFKLKPLHSYTKRFNPQVWRRFQARRLKLQVQRGHECGRERLISVCRFAVLVTSAVVWVCANKPDLPSRATKRCNCRVGTAQVNDLDFGSAAVAAVDGGVLSLLGSSRCGTGSALRVDSNSSIVLSGQLKAANAAIGVDGLLSLASGGNLLGDIDTKLDLSATARVDIADKSDVRVGSCACAADSRQESTAVINLVGGSTLSVAGERAAQLLHEESGSLTKLVACFQVALISVFAKSLALQSRSWW